MVVFVPRKWILRCNKEYRYPQVSVSNRQGCYSNFNLLLAAGLATFLACITFFLAFQLKLTAYVVSVKRTSILMTIVLGYVFFKEDHLIRSLVVGCIMVLGICLVSLG